MESTIIWTLIFSGATIGLLGIFLFASERELKRKRSQVEALSAQLNDPSELHGGDSTNDQPGLATDRSSELVVANAELSQRISDLTIQLQDNRDQIRRLQESQAQLSSLEMEAAELRSSHQRLQQENSELKDQILAAEEYPHGSSSTSEDVADHSDWMEDMYEIQEKLKNSEARVRELEMAQIAGGEFRDSSFKEHQSYLEARISELEKELAFDKEKLSDFEVIETRLKDFEQLYCESEDHNSRLREEMSRWQEQSIQNEEHGQRLALVRRHLDELELKQASLAEHHRRLQEETAAIGKLLDGASQPSVQLELSDAVFQNVADPFEVDLAEYRGSDSISGKSPPEQSIGDYPDESPTKPANDFNKIIAPQNSTSEPGDSTARTNGRPSYKILVVMIPVLLVVGTVAAGFLSKHPPEPEVSAASASTPASLRVIEQTRTPVTTATPAPGHGVSSAFMKKHRATQLSEIDGEGKETQVNTVSTTPGVRDRRINEPIAAKLKTASSQPIETANKPSTRTWGGYEVTRPTQVYSEPTENSQPIARLDSGTQVNVVASRDGWLEIRSKHGRPPGYIKNDAAVRIGHN